MFDGHGLEENRTMFALFSIHNDKTEISCMLGTHVDYILWAAIIDSVLAEFDTREIKSDTFRCCGLEVVQDEDFTASITASGNIEKIDAASYPRDSPLTRKFNEVRHTAQIVR
eukprot:1652866-Pyramimonas_sp.AAC.2